MVLMNPFAEQRYTDIENRLWTEYGKKRVGQVERGD